jgi:hypothetical protein
MSRLLFVAAFKDAALLRIAILEITIGMISFSQAPLQMK